MKTVIVYSSKYGATEVCAKKIGQLLDGVVDLVNLKMQKEVDLKSYDKVLIGSSIYAGMMRKEVKAFCTTYEAALKEKKLGVFLSCFDDKGTNQYLESNLPEGVRKQVLEVACCGGRFDFKRMNFFEKFMIKQISKMQKAEESVMPKVDGKNNIDMISDEKIKQFVAMINKL